VSEPPADERLRAALAHLADSAPPPGGTATAERAMALARGRRRRWAGLAAALVLVVGVLVAVPEAVSQLTPAPAERPVPATAAGGPASLYDLPVRGSLAGDEEFLAGVRSLDWSGPAGPEGDLRPAEDTRRVAYAADVPGRGRWALVLGRVGPQLVHAWFTGPAGAAPGGLALTGGPSRTGTAPAITLLDAAGPTGTLVVVGRPEDGAEYSPSIDRDSTGRLRRTFTPLPLVDGVPVGEVVAPVVYGAGQVRVLSVRGGRVARDVLVPTVVGGPVSAAAGRDGDGDGDGSDPRYWDRLRDCLVTLGFEVRPDSDGTGLTWSGGPAIAPDVGPLSTGEQAQNDAAAAGCVARASG